MNFLQLPRNTELARAVDVVSSAKRIRILITEIRRLIFLACFSQCFLEEIEYMHFLRDFIQFQY